MTDYAHIITHTPEQASKWREIATSNPGRVARALMLQPGQTTREGDKQGDMYPALQVVREISMLTLRSCVENKVWADLVESGIADALCKNVCEMATFFEAPPDMPNELLEKVKNEVRSPYYAPLEILCNASVTFKFPPTKTDKKVIAALRRNWSEMMDRIWSEPENSLRPEDSHNRERMVVAQLVLRMVITDPPFISILYEPSDLTIQIIARHWKYSQKSSDISLTAETLYVLLVPNHPRQILYLCSNGLESATSRLVCKVLLGVGPTALSSKQQQAKALLAACAEHLVRLTGSSAADELMFLMGIISEAKKDPPEPEVAKAVLKATPLWNAMFRLLKKSAKPAPPNNPRMTQDREKEKKDRLRVIRNIVGTLSNTLHDASFDHPRECEPLVRIWANENFFGSLEETVEMLITMPGMTMQLSGLASMIDTTASKGTPSLLRVLRTQFPRWRILGTLLRHDIQRQQGIPPVYLPGLRSPPDDNVWDHAAWQCFGALQFRCMDKTACGKRGCENPTTIACMCEVVKYCSENCKTRDEKDHQLVCELMGLLQKIRIPGSTKQAASPPIQTTQRKKNKLQIPGPFPSAAGADA